MENALTCFNRSCPLNGTDHLLSLDALVVIKSYLNFNLEAKGLACQGEFAPLQVSAQVKRAGLEPGFGFCSEGMITGTCHAKSQRLRISQSQKNQMAQASGLFNQNARSMAFIFESEFPIPLTHFVAERFVFVLVLKAGFKNPNKGPLSLYQSRPIY